MKKSVMKKWVTALRSGKYKQGQDRLRSDVSHFCCLGVLCDIIAKDEWKTPSAGTANAWGNDYNIYKEVHGLPKKIQILTGVRSSSGKNLKTGRELVYFNDGTITVKKSKSFKWIANYIERNWKNL